MRNYDTAPAVACLGGILLDILKTDAPNLSLLEESAIEVGHGIISRAVAFALESHDADLCAALQEGAAVHERRPRTLATMIGDMTFPGASASTVTATPCRITLRFRESYKKKPSLSD